MKACNISASYLQFYNHTIRAYIPCFLLLYCFTATQSHAQCNSTTSTVTGGSCEGTTFTANTTGGILQQLRWNWQSRNDSTVFISTASVLYHGGITIAGGNGYDNNTAPEYEAADNQCEAHGICMDKAGNLYVTDAPSSRVQKWVPGAKEGITIAGGNGPGGASNQLFNPQDVLVDDGGNVYISDAGNYRIQKWVPGAKEGITIAGGPDKIGIQPDQFNYPAGLCFDKEGNLYVADHLNDRIQKWAPGAKEGVTVAGGNGGGPAANQIHHPFGVFVDDAGNIYVAGDGYYTNRVQKWAPGAKEGITVAGGIYKGWGATQLNYPQDIFVDDLNNLYVADGGNNRIQKWVAGADSGITVAGGNLNTGDGPDEFYQPSGIFVISDTMYVSDPGNYRVQKFIPDAENPQINYSYKPTNGGNYTATARFKEGCNATSPSVHVKGLPKFKNITGQKRNLCVGGIFTYSVNAVGEAETYTWVAPAGCTILSGQGTESVTISIPATGFKGGVISVSADNRCGTGPVFYDTISTKPVQPGAIKGPVKVATYATVKYSVVPEPGISYRWEIPVNGVVIVSGQNTPAITVAWNSFVGGEVIVKASACSNGSESKNRLAVTATSLAFNKSDNIIAKNSQALKVYPNPAQNKATVAFTAKGTYNIQLSDATGKLIKTIKGNAVAGENKVDIDLSRLSSGVYFVTLIADNKKQVVTLSKQ